MIQKINDGNQIKDTFKLKDYGYYEKKINIDRDNWDKLHTIYSKVGEFKYNFIYDSNDITEELLNDDNLGEY